MRQNKAHMDNHFKEKLDNYSPKAPADCWDTIEFQLDQTIAPKRKNGIWYMAAASIAIIALSATLFSILTKNNQQVDQQFTTNESKLKNTKQKETIDNIPESNKSNEISATNQQTISHIKIANQYAFVNPSDKEDMVIDNSSEIQFDKLIPVKPQPYSYTKNLQIKASDNVYIAENRIMLNNKNEEIKISDKIKISKRWSVGLDFGPSYSYRYLTSSDKNQESVAYYNTVENPIQTYTGGLNVQYQLLKRLTIQSGFYYAQMGQSIGNLIVYDNQSYDLNEPSFKENFRNSYTLLNSIGDINVSSRYVVIDKTNIRVNINTSNSIFFDKNDPALRPLDAKILQSFEYIDIPLLFNYKIIDRKVDLNMVVGAGFSFLFGNEVSVIINDAETIIGETKAVSETNYTANIGLGLELPVINNLKFRIEPMFKYQINSLNPESEFEWHPYSFAVISGFCLSL